MITHIPYGEWLPDIPAHQNPGMLTARNCKPYVNSYGPISQWTAFSDALPAYPRGNILVRDKDNNVYYFVGDETDLYDLTGTGWTERTRTSGGDYATATDEVWEFAQWSQIVVATNFSDEMQSITLGGANFANLGGTPPQARHIAVVRDFMVAGNTWDASDGNVPNRIRWCAKGDITDWTIAAATQADKEDLLGEGGWVQRVVGGEYGIVFQERSVWRMTYVGSPVVFQLDEIMPSRGTIAPGSVIRVGHLTFFLSNDGFEVLVNGTERNRIGHNKVDRTFFADLDEANIHRMSATASPKEKLVYWSYPGEGNSGGTPNKVLIFDWENQRWSEMNDVVYAMGSASDTGTTMDAMDAVLAETGTDLVTNGTFATDSDWTKGTGWTIGSGTATHAAGTASVLSQDVSPTDLEGYYLTFTVSGRSAGSVTPSIGGTDGTARSTNATFNETIHCGTGDDLLAFTCSSDFDGSIDNVTLYSVSLDDVTESLDSSFWGGTAAEISAFDENFKLGFFNGDSMQAIFETGELEMVPGQRAMLSAVRPLIDGTSSITVEVYGRSLQGDAAATESARSVNSNGRATYRDNNRYHKVKVTVAAAANFTHAKGLDLEGEPFGHR
jgi:hypothetical protein